MSNPNDSELLDCDDLARLPGYPGCCSECHSIDENDVSSHMSIVEFQGKKYYVCCQIMNWLLTIDPTIEPT